MKPVDLWRKMINAKVYTKEVAERRVNVVFVVGQLSVDEYTELMELIDVKYVNVA
ncbi:hypothetical protein [Sporosarcina sp. D27]|uniref:hypothetical protein n=1 Tax=Sporosarcina sp. D27 TaxID=1382305 RepID=UPI0004AD1B83|nr:hypothetical protein [Sporosarcina sp. D27]